MPNVVQLRAQKGNMWASSQLASSI